MSRLRDPFWQFASVAVAILFGIITIYFLLTGRPYKGLRIQVLSNSPLVSVNADIANDIHVLYKDKPVQSLSLILLQLENTGNQPLTEGDYGQPIHISVSPNAQIGEVSLQESRPAGIPLTSSQLSNNQLELAKVLLNPGDQAVLKVLVLNNDGTLNIEGRIAGISEIETITGLQSSPTVQLPSSLSILQALAIMFVFFGPILAIIAITDSHRFNAWRQRRGHYDPALTYYKGARDNILVGRLSEAIHALDRAFSWDKSYVEKSHKDSVFLTIQDYEPYKKLIDKYK